MLDPIIEFLGAILSFLYQIFPNVGLAIILLTVLVNLAMFPLTLKQTRSMKAMQEIQPLVKDLQKKYKDDRQQLNEEMVALYKEKGVNPAAGCLPMIIQLPIWFSLFRLLQSFRPGDADNTRFLSADSDLGEAIAAGDTNGAIALYRQMLVDDPWNAFGLNGLRQVDPPARPSRTASAAQSPTSSLWSSLSSPATTSRPN